MSLDLPTPTTGRGLAAVAAAGTLWGTGGITGTLLAHTTGLPSTAVATFRLGTGGLLLLALAAATRRPVPRNRTAWLRILQIGLLSAVYQAAYFTAVTLTSVPLATLVTIGASPVLMLPARALTGHRPDRALLTAVALAATGLVLLVGLPTGLPAGHVAAATGLSVLSAAGFVTLTLLGGRPVPDLAEDTSTGFGFTLGALLLTPLALATGGLTFTPTPTALGLLAALGAGPTALAYSLYFRGLRHTGAGTAAVLALLEPLTGTILAALLLHQNLTTTGLAGAALLTAALLLATRSRDRNAHPPLS
jgi:drug/metabolite transporter, DME family